MVDSLLASETTAGVEGLEPAVVTASESPGMGDWVEPFMVRPGIRIFPKDDLVLGGKMGLRADWGVSRGLNNPDAEAGGVVFGFCGESWVCCTGSVSNKLSEGLDGLDSGQLVFEDKPSASLSPVMV